MFFTEWRVRDDICCQATTSYLTLCGDLSQYDIYTIDFIPVLFRSQVYIN